MTVAGMGAWTNEVSITVGGATPPDVASASLSADKTEVSVGESVTFTLTVTLEAAPTSAQAYGSYIKADIYVNGSYKQSMDVSDLNAGQQTYTATFTLSFSEPGTYTVKAFVYVVQAGQPGYTAGLSPGAWTNPVTVSASLEEYTPGPAETLLTLLYRHRYLLAAIGLGLAGLYLLRKKH